MWNDLTKIQKFIFNNNKLLKFFLNNNLVDTSSKQKDKSEITKKNV